MTPPGEAALRAWGWTDALAEEIADRQDADLRPARVIAQHRGFWRLAPVEGESLAVAPGKMLYRATGTLGLPAVGDWVLARREADGPATIVEILPRATVFVRRKVGRDSLEQVVAANVDIVFLVTSLNQELNLRRIERYLVATWESGARPVVLLSKADLVPDRDARLQQVVEVASGAEVIAYSIVSGEGVDAIRAFLQPGRTIALLGSSGVGKSTLVNVLAGEELLRTQKIREADDKGRHTTTHREIVRLSCGALLLDTPGMREVGFWGIDEGLRDAFDDVEALVGGCRFRDCTHESEPGCAVRAAMQAGALSAERWESFLKLRKEIAYETRRQDVGAALAEKRRWKGIHKALRKMPKKQDR